MINLSKQRYEYMEEINAGVLRQIPFNHSGNESRILDVGCGSGALAEAMGGRGYRVTGVETNAEMCAIASHRMDRIIQDDLACTSEVRKIVGETKFDYVVFSDVLEHFYDPCSVIMEYKSFLTEKGKMIISVPNVAVWANRLGLMFGRFNYTDSGILDRTHIRFFTFKTIKDLVEAAGFTIEKIDYTPFIIRAVLPLIKRLIGNNREYQIDRKKIINSHFYKAYMKFIYPIEYYFGYLLKGFFAFRIIIVARKI